MLYDPPQIGWMLVFVSDFKGTQSRLNCLRRLAKLFNIVVFQSVSIMNSKFQEDVLAGCYPS